MEKMAHVYRISYQQQQWTILAHTVLIFHFFEISHINTECASNGVNDGEKLQETDVTVYCYRD
jgi:hypothetical protein